MGKARKIILIITAIYFLIAGYFFIVAITCIESPSNWCLTDHANFYLSIIPSFFLVFLIPSELSDIAQPLLLILNTIFIYWLLLLPVKIFEKFKTKQTENNI